MAKDSIAKLYHKRFELFLSSQVAILFGSLIVPAVFFENVLEPILFLINLLLGVLLISKKTKLMWIGLLLLVSSTLVLLFSLALGEVSKSLSFVRVIGYLLFYFMVTMEIIKQVWRAKSVNNNVIFGLVSGYVSLGFIAFFICLSIELSTPGSFQGSLLEMSGPNAQLPEQLMYFSFITLMTIGYGDILPTTVLAQKAAMCIGLVGQFYLVIITAIVVGKFLQQKA